MKPGNSKVAAGRLLLLGGWLLAAGAIAWRVLAADAPPADPLKDVAANTWTRLVEGKTGGREQPVFVYAPKIRRFVAAAGMQHYGGELPRHYDTEEFDLGLRQWFNAYPPGQEKGRPASGPVGEEYARERAKHGHNGGTPFYQDGEHLRVGAGGQWHDGKAYGEFCYVPPENAIYAYLWNRTLRYDVATHTWKDLQAKPREKCPIWGSLCYDPVNREILHAGGAGGSADLGTWVYSIEKNAWRQLPCGSDALRKLSDSAQALRWQAKELLGRCSSRLAVAETAAEAEVNLPALAVKLTTAAEQLAAEVKAAKLSAREQPAADMAVRRLELVSTLLQATGPALAGKLTPEHIAQVRSARVRCEQIADALSPEPPGRARSQLALDTVRNQIVLFGGDGLDRTLSDTWIYDCQSRAWEQRFPENGPSPRAGHVLAWLPQAKQVVLAGGYSRTPLEQEIWVYDAPANRWRCLLQVPAVTKTSPNAPQATERVPQHGAVDDNDVLVCPNGHSVWACKVDPARPNQSAAGRSAEAGSYTFNRIDPATWEKAAVPEAATMRQRLSDLPANQWTALQFPLYAPGATNRWGTTAYDSDRHQLLLWGGGHATSQEDDVAHFSVLGGGWTIGYHPDDPIERVYASQPTPLSFQDRVHVPIHAYKAYCYDPTARKMFYFDRAYDPLVREWLPASYPGLEHRGPMHSHMEATPKGAVTYSDKGLFRFDAQAARWHKLPWNGPAFGGIWCDGHSLCYDSKRDCLWFASDKTVLRYNLGSHTATRVEVKKPQTLGQFYFWGEEVYLPEADLLLLMNLFKRPDGRLANVAWDPNDGKFYWAELAFVEAGKPVEFKNPPFSWSDSLTYDAKLKLLVLNNSSARKVWVAKFDRKTARLEEIKD
ncbi:MAG: hypothetical protein JNM56_28530 [Planctomycetia bacterium]|nr:hypothetical protein [Planctomycetia bacterium]